MNKLYIGSDHTGVELKRKLSEHATEKGYQVIDLGPSTDEVSVSYAEKGLEVGHAVADNKAVGIAICGTGLGISYAVNRVKGIRGARVVSKDDARMAKEHNNANILVFGARQITSDKAIELFDEWDRTKFEGGRHIERIERLDK
ncbi:MAG: RpiB/LacA/LacB family sugar-phosphate isomerase [Mycoplasmataceae bacterium]|nr:RpiB/LacA/LacB family sugar-phosphate isomerase [Mycoplasmataceae bacterium]